MKRQFLMRVAVVTGTVVSLVGMAVVAARQPDERQVRVRHEVRSPTGRFTAKVVLEDGPDGMPGWRPVVVDEGGATVFRGAEVLPERPEPRIVWERDLDTLWVSAGGVVAFVQEGLQGWSSTTLAADDAHLVPAEARV